MKKETKLKNLRNALNKMSKQQLDQNILYNSESLSISGVVSGFGKSKTTLYYTGEDDPAQLYTMKQLKERYDKDEIEGFDIEINRGDFIIKF